MLKDSNIGQTIVNLSKNNANYVHESDRKIRHGYMAVLMKIANLIFKNIQKDEIKTYVESVEGWQEFYDNELKKINEVYNRSLGG